MRALGFDECHDHALNRVNSPLERSADRDAKSESASTDRSSRCRSRAHRAPFIRVTKYWRVRDELAGCGELGSDGPMALAPEILFEHCEAP